MFKDFQLSGYGEMIDALNVFHKGVFVKGKLLISGQLDNNGKGEAALC